MPLRFLSYKVLEVILLLIGLYVLQVTLLFTLPLIPIYDMTMRMSLIENAAWIGNVIFGLTIFWLLRKKGAVAIAVAILSIVLPLYGPIFYILTTLQDESKID
jgi:hypothetical protein